MFHVLSCTALLLTVDLEKTKLLFLALSAEKMKKRDLYNALSDPYLPVMSPRSNTFFLRHGSQFLRKDKIVKSGRNLEHVCGFRRWNGVN